MPLEANEIAEIGTGALGLVQAGLSLADKAAARRRQRKLFDKWETFKTPKLQFDILHALESRAQGLDPGTLAYLTGETDKAFSSTLGTAQRLGADPNDVSAIFDQKINGILKIGEMNHAANMEGFSKVIAGMDAVKDSQIAEFVSRQEKLKNQLAAEGVNVQSANIGLQSGLNTVIAAGSAYAQSQLYKDKKLKDNGLGSYLPTTPNSRLLDNNLLMGTSTQDVSSPPLGYIWDAAQGKYVRG